MSAWSGVTFKVYAEGETPFEAVRLADRLAQNIAADLPVEVGLVFNDAEFTKTYPGFRASLSGYLEES